jgi:hypothetical protein
MPAAVLKSFAEKSGKSIETLERYWTEAKETAREKGLDESKPEFFAFVTAVVKKRAGLSESLQDFANWILDIAIDEAYERLDEEEGEEDPLGLGGLPPLGKAPAAPGQPGGEDPDKLPPQNIKGETLIQQYARKKGKTEFEIEQIWNKIKDKARIWQAEKKTDDNEMLEYAVKIFQETMEIIPDAPPPEAIAQQAAIAQLQAGNTGALMGGDNAEEKKPGEEKKAPPAEKKDAPPAEKKDAAPEEEKKKEEESKAKTEAAIQKAEDNLKEALGIKAARNTVSSSEMKILKGVGLKKKDIKALDDSQVKILLKKIKKANKKAAINTKKGKGFSFLGNTILAVGAFGGGFLAGKALDAAFKSIFSSGKKSINPNFGGSDF